MLASTVARRSGRLLCRSLGASRPTFHSDDFCLQHDHVSQRRQPTACFSHGCRPLGDLDLHNGGRRALLSPLSASLGATGLQLEAGQGRAARLLSTKANAAGDSEGSQGDQGVDSGASTSWFGRMKSLLTGKSAQAADEQEYNMEQFASQLRQAQRMGNLVSFGRGLPKGGEKMVINSLKVQEQIVRAMTEEERAQPELLMSEAAKARVATSCGCGVADVDVVLAKYQWMKEAHQKMAALKREGKPVPKTMEEVETMMGRGWVPTKRSAALTGSDSKPSRNAPCPCNSGKRYKRCCGSS